MSATLAGDAYARETHLKLWDSANGTLIRSFQSRDVSTMALSPSGKSIFALQFGGGGILQFDLETGALLQSFPETRNVGDLAFSGDGALCAIGDSTGVVRLWSTNGPLAIGKYIGARVFPGGIAFSPDQRRILSGSRLIDMSWPARYRDLKPNVERAMKTLQDHPDDAESLKTVGEWHVFNAIWDWAADSLEKARARGAAVSPLTLAQCYWQLKRFDDARREYARALAEAKDSNEKFYLQLCVNAVERSSPGATTQPATQAKP